MELTVYGDISASGDLYGRSLVIGGGATPNRLTDIFTYGGITGSQAISSSGNIYGNTIQAGGASTLAKTAVLAYGGITGSQHISASGNLHGHDATIGNRVTSNYGTINYSLVVNENGHGGGDLRVESANEAYMIFSNANFDGVGFGTSNPVTGSVAKITVEGSISASGTGSLGRLNLTDSGSAINFIGDISGSLLSTGSFGRINFGYTGTDTTTGGNIVISASLEQTASVGHIIASNN